MALDLLLDCSKGYTRKYRLFNQSLSYFRHHEEKYGKKTNFNEEDYTTKLPSADTPENREKWAEAARVASEIEANPTSHRNTALENGDGDDEESRFSAVVRPSHSSKLVKEYFI